MAFRARLPGGAACALGRARLPSNWRESPIPRSVQAVGDAWLKSESSLALRVPSAVVPAEDNALINPDHPRFEEGTSDGPLDPDIDDRLT